MSFRMDDILFFEVKIILCFLLIISLFFLYIDFFIFVFVFAFVFLVLFLHIKTPKEYIFINENGIACYLKKQCLWEYNWNEILDLCVGSRYRQKSIEIYIKSSSKDGKGEYSYHYFQYGKKAKKALALYYPKEIKKLKTGNG